MNKLIEKIVERLRNFKKPRYGIGFEYITINDAISIIQEEAEAYKGEWKFSISGVGHYNCSVCGGRGDFYGKYNYCPHCGSQMKEDVEAKTYNELVKGDLISRSLLLEEIKSLRVTVMGLRAGKGILAEYAKQYKDTLLRVIKEQPTAYNDGWIPCNERLPDRCQYVLCTASGNLEPKHEVVICAYNGEMFWHDGSITAWQPLPTPYQPKGE